MIILATIFTLAGFSNTTLASDTTPYTCDFHNVRYHLDRTNELFKKGYDKDRWEDKTPLKNKEKRAVKKHKFCLNRSEDRQRVENQRDRHKKKFSKYRREQIFIQKYTPFPGPNGTYWAIPWSIVSCESGGNFTQTNNAGSGAGGAYQIMPDTWINYGGGKWASRAEYAPPKAQHIIASRIWAGGSGRSQWECKL